MGRVRVLPVLLSGVTAAVAAAGGAFAQPQIPATFYGSVTIDGAPAAAGTEVRAIVNGLDCTQATPGQRPVFIDGDIAAYVLYVVHETQREGCARDGSRVTFTINGRPAIQTAVWKAGPIPLDLSSGDASPIPLPSPTPTLGSAVETLTAAAEPPEATATGTPTPKTGTPSTEGARLNSTPLPPGAASPGGSDESEGSPILPVIGGTLIVLAVGAGAAGYVLSRKHRRPPDSSGSTFDP
jgi:hypothetical protein